ncbi:MAG: toprim domain-containing protein [Patescibacteria group bacterium]
MASPEIIQRLIEHFSRLPSIGPRQASRFVSFLLDENPDVLKNFGETIITLSSATARCTECFRIIEAGKEARCSDCMREPLGAILVLEKDQDLDAVLKSGAWNQAYHVLGGTISLMNEKNRVTDRMKALFDRLERRLGTQDTAVEVVLATSATVEGDSTALYIERILEPFIKSKRVSLTRLGRGLSTGSEIEYADPETIVHALSHRR